MATALPAEPPAPSTVPESENPFCRRSWMGRAEVRLRHDPRAGAKPGAWAMTQ